jgi:nitrite reductase/ring-hydroxylating ferredoxin subunit
MRISAVNLWSWYPVVASSDLQAGAVMPAMLHGERLVVWRSREGRIGVWNDRCPHRSMSLSLGATTGETLVCPYHGWEFGSDGNCRRIPAHPALTPSRAARARVYPAIEASNYVWACLGEPASANPEYGLIARLVLQPIRSMHVRADVETVALILLSHPLAAHAERPPKEPADCQIDGGILAVTHVGESGHAICRVRLGLPSIVVCQPDPAAGSSAYAALVQPTGEDTAVIHLALLGSGTQAARLALNSALVRLRHRMPALAHSALLLKLRDAIAGSAQPAPMNVMSKGFDDDENN